VLGGDEIAMSESQVNLNKVTLRMAVAFGVLFSFNALGTCMVASLTNVKWVELPAQSKFMIIVIIFVNWTGTLMAFLSKTVARLETGKGLPTNGTDFFSRAGTDQFQTQGLPIGNQTQTQTERKLEVKTTEVKPSE